jgi:CheY-like chemotaxis protein
MNYRKILLIDDDEDDQEIFMMAVNEVSKKAECVALSDASMALKKLENKEVVPDVIFLDLNMPIMNGQQFLVEIKKRDSLKNIPVIVFSTSFHQATIDLTKELGAKDFITKPNNLPALIKILEPLLNFN